MTIKFQALVKEVKSKSLVSGDKSYRVLLETLDVSALEAGKLAGDQEAEITIEL